MPVYEYKCASCGTAYDVYHKGREIADDVVCPACRSNEHTKLMSASSVSTRRPAPARESCTPGGCCGGGMCETN